MSLVFRRHIPIAITFFVGVILALQYAIKLPTLDTLAGTLKSYGVIVAAFALGLASVSLIMSQYRVVKKREPRVWYAGVAAIFGFALFIIVGLVLGTKSGAWNWLSANVYTPMTSGLLGVAGFLFVTASYRAFKARTLESACLLISGVLVMLANAPVGEFIWKPFAAIGQWMMNVPMTNVERAMLITTAVGAVAIAVRTLLGWQRSYLPTD